MRKTLLALVLGLAACGGGGDLAFEDLGDEFEAANCDFDVKCGFQPDDATCEESLVIDPAELDSLGNAIAAGTIIYDSGAAAACVEFISEQSCEFTGFNNDEDPCDDMFTGTVPVGGACNFDLECADGGDCEITDPNCDPDVTCCTGTCGAAAPPPVAVGGSCESSDDCLDSYCKFPDMQAQTGTCTAFVTNEGGACDSFTACADPLYCDLDFSTFTGVCARAASSNQACDPDALIPCADLRDYCDTGTSTCTRAAGVGSACSETVPCVGFASCIGGTCVQDPSLGDACSDTTGDCLGSLECINGTCGLEPPGLVCPM